MIKPIKYFLIFKGYLVYFLNSLIHKKISESDIFTIDISKLKKKSVFCIYELL